MAKLRIQGDTSGYVDLEAPNAASSRTIDLDQVPQLNNSSGDTFVHSAGQFQIKDSNGYARITANNGSAQLGLFRAGNSAGGGYIGADGDNMLDVRDASFATKFKITQNGYVTMPYQPAFFAYISGSNQTLTGGDWTKVNLNTTSGKWNVGSHFDTANGRFVAPVTGLYFISYTVNFPDGVNGYYYSGLKLNGNFYAYGDGRNIDTQLTDNTLGHGTSIRLNANDYVELWAYRGTTGGISTGTLRTHMNGCLLG